MAGSLAAAVGTAAGFTTAFSVVAAADVTGQSGIGVMFSEVGWLAGLGTLMFVRGAWLTGRRRKSASSA